MERIVANTVNLRIGPLQLAPTLEQEIINKPPTPGMLILAILTHIGTVSSYDRKFHLLSR